MKLYWYSTLQHRSVRPKLRLDYMLYLDTALNQLIDSINFHYIHDILIHLNWWRTHLLTDLASELNHQVALSKLPPICIWSHSDWDPCMYSLADWDPNSIAEASNGGWPSWKILTEKYMIKSIDILNKINLFPQCPTSSMNFYMHKKRGEIEVLQ